MARPSIFPDWARTTVNDPTSGQPNVATPSESRKDLGFGYKQRGPRQFFNWLFKTISEWVHYLDEAVTATDVRLTAAEGEIITIEGDLGGLDTRLTTVESTYVVRTDLVVRTVRVYMLNNSTGVLSSVYAETQMVLQRIGNLVMGTVSGFELLNNTGGPLNGLRPVIDISDAFFNTFFPWPGTDSQMVISSAAFRGSLVSPGNSESGVHVADAAVNYIDWSGTVRKIIYLNIDTSGGILNTFTFDIPDTYLFRVVPGFRFAHTIRP